MRWRVIWRASAATWAAVGLGLFLSLLLNDTLTSSTAHGYWPAVAGTASLALTFVTPACSGAGAWE
ncbi:hypothetical protein, partial [Streptomyces sp. URMC 123]|uniref:hypothetical protein n=1 Tax=Streptomyces sp. URMC 123 TaxID=3423403 RepID=UPI003F1BE867